MSKSIGLFFVCCIFLSCQKDKVAKGTPNCIEDRISEEKKKCLSEVYSYTYQGEKVYLFVADKCADYFNEVYNASCEYRCSPSGGITGSGDGKCADFFNQASNKELVWKE